MSYYINQESTKSKFFLGPEVESTPANGKKTLFVIGSQSTEKIEELAAKYKVPHIFLGANQSFNFSGSHSWNKQISHLLSLGYYISLEYPSQFHNKMLETLEDHVWKNRLFIPIISVRLAKMEQINNNLTLKIDDAEFAKNNTGIWCLNFHEIIDNNRLTTWNQYEAIDVDMYNTTNKVHVEQPKKVVKEEKPILTSDPTRASPDINDTTVGIDPRPTSAIKLLPEDEIEEVEEKKEELEDPFPGLVIKGGLLKELKSK